MTKEAAIYSFFSGFGIPAYAESSVPDGAELPYITYELKTGDITSGDINTTVNVWYYTESEAEPNAKVRDIEAVLGIGGTMVNFDGGAVWMKRGSPWCQSVTDDSDMMIKRRYLNVDLEFIST